MTQWKDKWEENKKKFQAAYATAYKKFEGDWKKANLEASNSDTPSESL